MECVIHCWTRLRRLAVHDVVEVVENECVFQEVKLRYNDIRPIPCESIFNHWIRNGIECRTWQDVEWVTLHEGSMLVPFPDTGEKRWTIVPPFAAIILFGKVCKTDICASFDFVLLSSVKQSSFWGYSLWAAELRFVRQRAPQHQDQLSSWTHAPNLD